MATIKAYTSIEQSKKLSEILPIESADMCYPYDRHLNKMYGDIPYVMGYKRFNEDTDFPCWSLAALLEELDDEITDEEGNDYTLTIVKENLQYQLYYRHVWDQTQDIEIDYYDDMVDACYEMIIKLYKLNLL